MSVLVPLRWLHREEVQVKPSLAITTCNNSLASMFIVLCYSTLHALFICAGTLKKLVNYFASDKIKNRLQGLNTFGME